MSRWVGCGRLAAVLATVVMLSACAGGGSGVPTPTRTATVLPTSTATAIPSATASTSPTRSPTQAATPTSTETATSPPTPTLTTAATATATSTSAATATGTPTATATTSDPSEIDLLPPAVSAEVDTLIRSIMATDFIPGLSAAIAHNGQTVLAKGYGYAACATSTCSSGTAVQADTPFEMGSVTKAFTAIGLMRILDNPALNTSNLGALDLSAPISQYLSSNPEFTLPQQWDNITLTQLLSMSSGIEDFGSNTMTWPVILDHVGMQPLLFAPGTGYCYSNPGFMVIGAVIQALTETPYAEFMQQQVFAPAAMNDTLIHTPDNAPSDLATGYAYDASTQTWTVPTPRPPLSSFSAGALISTAVDLGTFLSALQERALLNTATYDLMWTIVTLSDPSRAGIWGFGWEVTAVGSYQIFRKDGALPGVTSQVSLYDDGTSQIGVAIASNENSVIGYVSLAAQIIGAVLETPVPDPGPGGNGCTPTPCFNCPTPTATNN